MHRMTLTNESVTFCTNGRIWIQPSLSDGFWFTGSPEELISIMIAHPELDIDNTIIRVRDDAAMMKANTLPSYEQFIERWCRVRPISEVREEWREKYGDKDDI